MSDKPDYSSPEYAVQQFRAKVEQGKLLAEITQDSQLVKKESIIAYNEMVTTLAAALIELGDSDKLDEKQKALVEAVMGFAYSTVIVAKNFTDGREDFDFKNERVQNFISERLQGEVNSPAWHIQRTSSRLFF